MTWQVQEAEQRLSGLLCAAESEPQVISRRGEGGAPMSDSRTITVE